MVIPPPNVTGSLHIGHALNTTLNLWWGILAVCFFSTSVFGSPPACDRDDVTLFVKADLVITGSVTSSRKWQEGQTTIHLVAKYRVEEVFKGKKEKGDILIVTDTCLDQPIPQEQLGYPVVDRYCVGGHNLSLTGVNAKDGTPISKTSETKPYLLYLKKDQRPGAPELTWLEVSQTGYGGGCHTALETLPSADQASYKRLHVLYP